MIDGDILHLELHSSHVTERRRKNLASSSFLKVSKYGKYTKHIKYSIKTDSSLVCVAGVRLNRARVIQTGTRQRTKSVTRGKP